MPYIFGASDASKFGLAAHMGTTREVVAYRNFTEDEVSSSSTERELLAIQYGIHSFINKIKNKYVVWQTDNYAASLILHSGSNKEKLQDIAENVYNICKNNRITLKVKWIPREYNDLADQLSRNFDYDDWRLSTSIFTTISNLWGPFTVDRFASDINTKLGRFNSKFWCPNTECVDALSTSWVNENNYVVPPVHLVIKTVRHMEKCKALGVLVVPLWFSASFWPFICDNKGLSILS